MRKGLTLPNVAFRPYSAAEIAALDGLRPSVLVMLLYGGAIDQTHIQQIQAYVESHSVCLLFRPYAGNIPQWTPADWAEECFHRSLGLPGMALPLAGDMIPANEINLEGMGTDWQRQIDWLTAFARAWRKISARTLHLPALSPTEGYEYGLMAYVQAGLVDVFDVMDFHCYAPEHLTSARIVAQAITKPSMITEFNQLAPASLASETWAESATYFLLGGTPDQSQYDILGQPPVYQAFKNWQENPGTMANYTSPNHDGPRAHTLGIVIHATLSTKPNTVQQEYESTVNYFNNPTSQVSAHAVVGPHGQVTYPVPLNLIAWHCRESNATHLGIEMAKPHLGDVIGTDILDTAAAIVAGWCQVYQIPMVWSTSHGIAEHHEMPTNTDGHQDMGGPFDRADFLARVQKHAEGTVLTESQKAALLDHLNILWGETKADTIQANPAESERACHERIVAMKVLLGLNG